MPCLPSGSGCCCTAQMCWAPPGCVVTDLQACPGVSELRGLWDEGVDVEPDRSCAAAPGHRLCPRGQPWARRPAAAVPGVGPALLAVPAVTRNSPTAVCPVWC